MNIYAVPTNDLTKQISLPLSIEEREGERMASIYVSVNCKPLDQKQIFIMPIWLPQVKR